MISLDDPRWKQFEGGYRVKYDASIPLRKLKTTTDKQNYQTILKELWENLIHQYDVGLASYRLSHTLSESRRKSDWGTGLS